MASASNFEHPTLHTQQFPKDTKPNTNTCTNGNSTQSFVFNDEEVVCAVSVIRIYYKHLEHTEHGGER